MRPRKGSAASCSRCHQTAPGYDQLAERRFPRAPVSLFAQRVPFSGERASLPTVDHGLFHAALPGAATTVRFERYAVSALSGIRN